jgi:glycosyltransferase involved in cell wall biosynthesis
MLPLALAVSLITGAILVYDAHELESDRNGLRKWERSAIRAVERLAWSRIAVLITVSPSIQDWYINSYGSKSSMVILNSPVVRENINFEEAYLRCKFGIPSDHRIYIYAGILNEGRGLEVLLKVFSRGDITSHLILVGYGPWLPRVSQVADERSNIHVHPPVPHDILVPLLRTADVGVCLVEPISLSDYLSIPNKLLEYIAAGLPVLASDLPELRSLVQTYGLGCCSELDSDAVAELVRSPPQDCGTEVAQAPEGLGWNSQAERLISLYQTLLAGPNKRQND